MKIEQHEQFAWSQSRQAPLNLQRDRLSDKHYSRITHSRGCVHSKLCQAPLEVTSSQWRQTCFLCTRGLARGSELHLCLWWIESQSHSPLLTTTILFSLQHFSRRSSQDSSIPSPGSTPSSLCCPSRTADKTTSATLRSEPQPNLVTFPSLHPLHHTNQTASTTAFFVDRKTLSSRRQLHAPPEVTPRVYFRVLVVCAYCRTDCSGSAAHPVMKDG